MDSIFPSNISCVICNSPISKDNELSLCVKCFEKIKKLTGINDVKEQLVLINPDLLLLPSYRDGRGFSSDKFREAYKNDPSLQTVKAIRSGALKSPRDAYIYNGSQDIVFGVQEIAFMAYGDAFAQPADEHLSAVE